MGEGIDKKEINPYYYSPLGNHNKMPAFIYSKYCQCHTHELCTLVETPFPQSILWANLYQVLPCIAMPCKDYTINLWRADFLKKTFLLRKNQQVQLCYRVKFSDKQKKVRFVLSLTRNNMSRTVKSTFYWPIFSKFYYNFKSRFKKR